MQTFPPRQQHIKRSTFDPEPTHIQAGPFERNRPFQLPHSHNQLHHLSGNEAIGLTRDPSVMRSPAPDDPPAELRHAHDPARIRRGIEQEGRPNGRPSFLLYCSDSISRGKSCRCLQLKSISPLLEHRRSGQAPPIRRALHGYREKRLC